MGLTEDEGWCRWCQSYGNVHDEERHPRAKAPFNKPRDIIIIRGEEAEMVESDPCVNSVVISKMDIRGCGHYREDHDEGWSECRLCPCGRYRTDGATE